MEEEAEEIRELSEKISGRKSVCQINEQKRKIFGKYLEKTLKERGKTQSWLAEQVGVGREAISLYIEKEMLPRKGTAKKLFHALEGGYNTLDEFFSDKLLIEKEVKDIPTMLYDVGIPSYA